jgi:HlyD family secretion protein
MDQLTAKTSQNGQKTTPLERPIITEPRRGRRTVFVVLGLFLLIVAAGVAFFVHSRPQPQVTVAPVERKSLVASVTATGMVNPQDTISVGSQVSGTIVAIDADYNSRVRAGDVLARLDPTAFQAALDQAQDALAQARSQEQASLAGAQAAGSSVVAAASTANAAAESARSAQAAVAAADADVRKSRAALTLAQRTLARDRALLAPGYAPQSQYDTDSSNEAAAAAALVSAQISARQARLQWAAERSQATASAAQYRAATSQAAGSIRSAEAARAAAAAAEAAVRQARLNLAHTIITAPVDGTVIARNVSLGQTVAASFQTPVLYTLAKDLRKMEIDLAVGEPDVGSVVAGESVDFTVLAYPTHTFHGTVAQIRENPTTVQNVVTYDSVVYEDNAAGQLRPGMTANASIHVGFAKNALVVPLAALSYRPPAKVAPAASSARSATPNPAAYSAWGNTGQVGVGALIAGSVSRVFLYADGKLHAVPVRVQLVSGSEAAVTPLEGKLEAGDQVAISTNAAAGQSASNSTAGISRSLR